MSYNPNQDTFTNYISDPNSLFAAQFVAFADAAATSPADMTGGSPNTTFTRNTSSPLGKVSDLLMTKSSGASRQGEGAAFTTRTIESADLGQVLEFSFDYKVASGTYVDDAVQVWAYDVANSVAIQLAPTNIKNVSVSTRWQGVFQTATNATTYRIGFFIPVTTDSANTIKFSNFYLGRQIKSYGLVPKAPTVTPLTASSGTYTTPTGVKYIVVDIVGAGGGGAGSGSAGGSSGSTGGTTVFGAHTANGGGAGLAGGGSQLAGSNTVGAGVTTVLNSGGMLGLAPQGDSNAQSQYIIGGSGGFIYGGQGKGGVNTTTPSPTANTGAGGSGGGWWNTTGIAGGGGGSGGQLILVIDNPAATYSYTINAGGAGGGAGSGGSAFAGSTGASGFVTVTEYYVGSSALLSSDADTRVVALNAYSTSGQSIDGTPMTIIYGAVTKETHGAYASGTGIYTVPVPGWYHINAAVGFAAVSTTGLAVTIVLDNTTSIAGNQTQNTTSQQYVSGNVSVDYYLTAGQTIRIKATQTAAAQNYNGTQPYTYLSIHRLSGPSQIAASESVNFRAENRAGTTFTGAVLTYPTITHSSHGTGVWTTDNTFTAPVSGLYEIKVGLYGTVTLTTTQAVWMSARKNGATSSMMAGTQGTGGGATNYMISGSASVKLLAGETLDVYGSSSATFTPNTTAGFHWIAINRVGNY